MDTDRSTPESDEPSAEDEAQAIFAADDTGMLSGERIITVAETNSATPDAGDV